MIEEGQTWTRRSDGSAVTIDSIVRKDADVVIVVRRESGRTRRLTVRSLMADYRRETP